MAIKELSKRTEPDTGLQFNTFRDGSGGRSQGVAITDSNGEQTGISNNPLIVQFEPPTLLTYETGVLPESSALIAVGPTRLYHVRVLLLPAATTNLYLMLFDRPDLPADGAAPYWRTYVRGGGQTDETFDDGKELAFTSGMVAALSTDVDQLKLAGDVGFFHVRRL